MEGQPEVAGGFRPFTSGSDAILLRGMWAACPKIGRPRNSLPQRRLSDVVGAVIAGLAIVVSVLLIVGLFVRITGASLPIRNGVHGEATIEAYRDTGMYERGTGNFGSVYQLKLLVTPVGGGAPVTAEVKSTIDRIVDPSIGDRIPVIISPTNPRRVKVDHSRTRPRDDNGWHTTENDPDRPNT
jgi:hypothetical protein